MKKYMLFILLSGMNLVECSVKNNNFGYNFSTIVGWHESCRKTDGQFFVQKEKSTPSGSCQSPLFKKWSDSPVGVDVSLTPEPTRGSSVDGKENVTSGFKAGRNVKVTPSPEQIKQLLGLNKIFPTDDRFKGQVATSDYVAVVNSNIGSGDSPSFTMFKSHSANLSAQEQEIAKRGKIAVLIHLYKEIQPLEK